MDRSHCSPASRTPLPQTEDGEEREDWKEGKDSDEGEERGKKGRKGREEVPGSCTLICAMQVQESVQEDPEEQGVPDSHSSPASRMRSPQKEAAGRSEAVEEAMRERKQRQN